MGRMSNADKLARAIKPTHQILISMNAVPCKCWPVTEVSGNRILDKKEASFIGSSRKCVRVSANRLEVQTGYGKEVYELRPL